jgi:hypothetical protein
MAPGRKDDVLRSTQRPSGRRQRKKNADSTANNKMDDKVKENEPPTSTTTSRRKQRGTTKCNNEGLASSSSSSSPFLNMGDKKDDGEFLHDYSDDKIKSKDIEKDSEVQILIQELQNAIRHVEIKIPTTIGNPAENDDKQYLHQEFLDRVARSSLGVPKPRTRSFVEEHSSSLLSWSRKLIKEVATATNGDKAHPSSRRQAATAENHLLIAVHVLRSIAMTLLDDHSTDLLTTDRHESLVKLFFHLIVTSAEVALKVQNESCFVVAGRITYLGYEGLGYALSSLSIKVDSGSANDGNGHGLEEKYISLTARRSSHIDSIVFAIPSDAAKTSRSKQKIASMSVRQLVTIAVKTSMALSKVLDRSIRDFPNSTSLPKLFNDDAIPENNISMIIRFLQHQIIYPWLVLMARQSSLEKDVVQEILSYSKGSHRLLWDVASTIKTNHDESTLITSDEAYIDAECLSLRKDAISMLLLDTFVPEMERALRKTTFESACTYAWKAAGVYSQSAPKRPNVAANLKRFYDDIDGVIEKIAFSSDLVPLSFVEYKAYKATHVPGETRSESMTNRVRSRSSSQRQLNDGNFQIILDLVKLCSCLNRRISTPSDENLSEEKNTTTLNEDNIVDSTESLIRRFHNQVTRQVNEVSMDVHNQIFKIFGILGLEKVLYNVVKEETDIRLLELELKCSAKILVDCIAAYSAALMKAHPDQTKKRFDQMIECFIRSIGALDRCAFQRMDDAFFSSECMELSNEYCNHLHEMMSPKLSRSVEEIPLQCQEKAAKVRHIDIMGSAARFGMQ